jgi:hypothetical protein
VWEFGTDTGMSTVAISEGLGPEAKIFTVDVDCWTTKQNPWLVEADFASGRVTQVVSDMMAPDLYVDHLDSLRRAELIFVDGPKDGTTELAFLKQLDDIPFQNNPIVVFDDIRLMNMISFWRGLQRPKMDMTSFGHWSGTGLVDWHPQPGRISAAGAAGLRAQAPSPKPNPPPKPIVQSRTTSRILMLCHEKPNYVPDLLLHGLRKLLGDSIVDYPRKNLLYEGCLGQPYLDRINGLMAADNDVDRSDLHTKIRTGFFDIVLSDVRAIAPNSALLRDATCPVALIDGEDRPAHIKPGNYVILRRETDGSDFSVPLPMSLPVEVLDLIARHADVPKTHIVGFLGSRSNLTPERNLILDEVCRIFPDALIDSWDVSRGRWQARDACYHAMQSCSAVLNLPGAGFDTFRFWENAACNAAHLAKRMPLFIPSDFRDGSEILRFDSVNELIRIIEQIASGAVDWQELAQRSGQWLRAHHTTERRAAMTLGHLSKAFQL